MTRCRREELPHLRQRVAPLLVLLRRAAVRRHDDVVVAHVRLGSREEHAVVGGEARNDELCTSPACSSMSSGVS